MSYTGWSLKAIGDRFRKGIDTHEDDIGSVGNLGNPLLDLPLNSSLAMKQGSGSVTFSRSSTATYIDRYGVLQYASIDEPRFEKNGLLLEGESTNLFLQSQFASGWLTSRSTLTPNSTTAPDGTTTAAYLDETAVVGTSYTYQSVSLTNGVTYANSLFVKQAEASTIAIRDINDIDYVYTFATHSITAGAKAEKLGNTGWVRISVSAVFAGVTGAKNVVNCILSDNADATGNGIYVWGAQLEALPFATSYIPTTTTALTRDIDKPYIDKPYIDYTKPFTIVLDHTYLGTDANAAVDQFCSLQMINDTYPDGQAAFQMRAETGNNRYGISFPDAGNTAVGGTLVVGNTTRICAVYDGTSLIVYINGELTNTQAINNSLIRQGEYSILKFNGWASNTVFDPAGINCQRNLKIYDRALTATEAALA